MGLEKIRQAVQGGARAEAIRIIESAKRSSDSFSMSQKEAAAQESERACKLRMQVIEDEYNRKLIQFKGMAGKQILDKRNTLLKSIFERSRREILAWPSEKYATVMGRLIEKTAVRHEGKIRVHPEDQGIFQRVLSELNEGRGDAAIVLDPGAPLPERGGFIFVRADFEVDQTLDTIFKEIEHDLLPAIAADLFPEK